MKATSQISPKERGTRSFPSTDYNYQPATDAKSVAGQRARKSPAFYRLSHEFFGAEAYRDYVTNFLVFTVLGLISAWPIMSMVVAVTRLLGTY